MRSHDLEFDEYLYAASYDDHLTPYGIARCDIDSKLVETLAPDGNWIIHPSAVRISPHVGEVGALVLTERAFIPITNKTARDVIATLRHLSHA